MAEVPESPELSPSPFTQANCRPPAWPALPETPWPSARVGLGFGSVQSSFDGNLHELPETPLPIVVATPPCRPRQRLLPETLLRTHRPQSDTTTLESPLPSFPETPLLTHTQQHGWDTPGYMSSPLPHPRPGMPALAAPLTRRSSIPQTPGFDWCTTPAPKPAQSPTSLPCFQLAADAALPTMLAPTDTVPSALTADLSATDHPLDHWFIPETQSPIDTPTKPPSTPGGLDDTWLELPQTQLASQMTFDIELGDIDTTFGNDGCAVDEAKLYKPTHSLSQSCSPKSFAHPLDLSLKSKGHQPTPGTAQGVALLPNESLDTPCPSTHRCLSTSANAIALFSELPLLCPDLGAPITSSNLVSRQTVLASQSPAAEAHASETINGTGLETMGRPSPEAISTTPCVKLATPSAYEPAPGIRSLLCDPKLCHSATPMASGSLLDSAAKRSLSPNSARIKVEDAQTPMTGPVDQLMPVSTSALSSASLVTPRTNGVRLKTPTSILTDCTPSSQKTVSAHRLSDQGHRCTQLAFDWQRTMTKRKIRLTAKPTEWIDAFADPSPPAPLQCTVQPTPHCNRQKTLPSYGSSNIRARPMGISPRMAQLSSVTRVFLSPRSRRCFHCGTANGRQWRRGPDGPKTLCNPCGLWYLVHKRLPGHLAKPATPRIGPSTPVGPTRNISHSNHPKKFDSPSTTKLTQSTKRPRLLSPCTRNVPEHCSIVPDANVAVNFPSPTDGRTNHTANETMPSSQPYLATGAKRPRRTTTKRKLVATGDKPKRRTKRSQATKAPLELGQSSCSQPSCLFTAMTFLVTYPPNTKEPTASLDTVHPLLPRPELEALLQELGGHVVGSGIQAVQRFLTGPTIATTSTELQGDASTALPAEANTVPLPSVVLVSPYPSRTLKYLLALAVGIPCVRTEWVLDAQRLGQVPDYRRYRLPSGHSAWTQQCIAVPPALQQLPSPCPMGTGASAMNGDQPTNPADLLPQPRARTTIQSTRTSLNALAQRYGITLPGFALFAGWVVYVEGSPEFRANWTDLLSVVGCAVPNQRQLSSRLRSLRSRKLSPGQEPLRCDVILINSPSEASSRGDGKGGKAAPIVSQLIANAHSYLYPCSAQTATPADTLPALVTLASPDEALIDMVQVKLGPPPIVTSEWFVQCLVHHQLFDWHSHALFTHHEKYSSQT